MLNIGKALKQLNIDLEKLSEKTKIPYSKLLDLSIGSSELNAKELRDIAKAIGVSTDFLLSDPEEFEAINILFRKSFAGGNKGSIKKLAYQIDRIFEVIDKSNFNASEWKLPVFDQSPRGAFNLANFFRETFYSQDILGPLLDLPEVISEKLKCVVVVEDLGKGIDGASCIVDHVPFIFIAPRFKPRMLFTLAHELGHLLTHHSSVNFFILDKPLKYDRISVSQEESFASHFASNVLIPEQGAGIVLKNLRNISGISGNVFSDIEILYLARIYGVSFEVAGKRCEDLGLIPTGAAHSLYSKIIEKFGSPEKRADELGIPAREEIIFPKISYTVINEAISIIESGELSLGRASEILGIPSNEILSQKARFDEEDHSG